MAEKSKTYLSDHSEAVMRSHASRTAANTAAYLVNSGFIHTNALVLDIGCGPGTITADFAKLASQGHVIGIEPETEILEKARSIASERGIKNIEFKVGDIHALDFPDDTFDVVHVNQVLQHIADPILALREMRRVTKPGGVVAAREGDFETMTWYPDDDGFLEKWKRVHIRLAHHKGGEPLAGRRLISWAIQAGFTADQITASGNAQSYSTPPDRAWWSAMFADRTVGTAFRKHALESGFVTETDLNDFANALRQWGTKEDGWFGLLHGEVLCRV